MSKKEKIPQAKGLDGSNEKLSGSGIPKEEPNLVSTSNESSNASSSHVPPPPQPPPPPPPPQAMMAPVTVGGGVVGGEYDEFSDEFAWTCNPPFSVWKKENPAGWNPLLNSLSSLDESLRCPICHDIFQIPVSLQNCKHSFCSECIRKCIKSGKQSMRRKAECPVCREPCEEKHILSNWSLAETTQRWTNCRPHLWTKLASTTTTTTNTSSPTFSRKRRRTNTNTSQSSKTHDQNDDMDSEVTLSDNDDDDDNDFVMESPKRPLSQPVPASNQKRKIKSTPHYHGMKKKKLVQLLAADGLPTYGNEKEMKERHMEFITLYNAECDARYPRPVQQLVKEMMLREKQRKEEIVHSFQNGTRSHSTHMENLKKSRTNLGNANSNTNNNQMNNNSGPNTSTREKLSSGNVSFDANLKEGFQRLLATAKARGIASNNTRKQLTQTAPTISEKSNGYKNNPSPSPKKIENPYNKQKSFTSPNQPNPMVPTMTSIPSHTLIPIQNPLPPTMYPPNMTIPNGQPFTMLSSYLPPPTMPPVLQYGGTAASPIQYNLPQTNVPKAQTTKRKNSTATTKKGTPTPKTWSCHKCTYINERLQFKCEMCNTQRKKTNTST